MAAGGVSAPISHHRRFRVAYGLLILIVGIAGAVLGWELQGSSSTTSPPRWSAWEPSVSGVNAIFDIADHVGAQYRTADGRQLTIIKANFPGRVGKLDPAAVRADTLPVSTVVYAQTNPQTGQVTYSVGIPTFPTTVEYQLCGVSTRCAIPAQDGGGSAAQPDLHREGLALALYTLHYIPSLDTVVEILPPRSPGAASLAVVFRRLDIAPLVARPLAATLPAQITAARQQQIDQFMDPVTFSYTYQQLFDGSYQMVLSPPHQ